MLQRAAVAVSGTATVLLGLVLVPLPGPGWVVVGLGVALLGTEFAWAARLTDVLRAGVARVRSRPLARRCSVVGSVVSLLLPCWALVR